MNTCYDLNAEDWLLEEAQNNKDDINVDSSAVMEVSVGGIPCISLIDTGSTRSCISQDLYNQLVKSGRKMTEVHVTGVQVITAVGTKSSKVKKQVLVNIKIQDEVEDLTCLVISGLVYNVILGLDWLNKVRCVIDYKNSNLEFTWGQQRSKVSLRKSGESDCEEARGKPKMLNINFNSVDSMSGNRVRIATRSTNNVKEREEEVSNINKIVQEVEIPDEMRTQLSEVLAECCEVFNPKIGKATVYEHAFNITDTSEFEGVRYSVPLSQVKAVDEAIQEMLKDDIIEYSSSKFLNPLVVVEKKDKTVRLCLDARTVNKRIDADYERPQLIEELLQNFHGKSWFSSVDLRSSFWQIPLRKEDRKFTAFSHKGRIYQFTRVPFGMRTSSAGLVRAVNIALGEDTRNFVNCYVDDLLISSSTLEQHIVHIGIVLKKLAAAGFTIKLEKTSFCAKSVNFLGHTICERGVCPDRASLRKIAEIKSPKNVKQLRSFLGVTNYFRRAIPNYAYHLEEFRELLRKDTRWRWEERHERAFRDMKAQFEQPVTLAFPDESLPYYVITDACDKGLAGLLYQIVDGEKRVISLASRSLNKAEVRYTTTEKELLAIIYSLEKFRRYVLGIHFTIQTDHSALTFVKSCKLYNNRLSRWIIYLQAFDFHIEHVAGRENLIADFFSRNPEEENKIEVHKEDEIFVCVMGMNEEREKKTLFMNMAEEQENDASLRNIRQETSGSEEENGFIERGNMKYRLHNRLLEQKGVGQDWRVIVPSSLQEEITNFYHLELGHFGAGKVLRAIQENFTWKNMGRRIRQIISRCEICQKTKHPVRYLEGPHQYVLREKPGELVCIDLFGPLVKSRYGTQFILVMVDAFSKLVKLYPIRKATSVACWKKVEAYFQDVGKPKQLLSDNGTQFTAHVWRKNMEEAGVQQLYSSVRYPQGNMAERIMRELSRALRAYCNEKHNSWYAWVERIESWMNVVTHESTGMTAHEIHYGRRPTRKIAEWLGLKTGELVDKEIAVRLAREKLILEGERRKDRRKDKKTTEFSIGTSVLLRVTRLSSAVDKVSAKMFHLFEGPYVISKRCGKCAYRLIDDNGKLMGTYNVRSLKRFLK